MTVDVVIRNRAGWAGCGRGHFGVQVGIGHLKKIGGSTWIYPIGGFHKWGTTKWSQHFRENPTKMDDLGYPYFRNPPPYGYFEIAMEHGPLIDDKYDDVPWSNNGDFP